MNAVQYNKQRGLDTDTIKRIQRTVGAFADGKWGPRTVAKIRKWQSSQGLSADGKVGPGTMKQFETCWAQDDELEGDEDLDDLAEGEEPLDPDEDDDDAEREEVPVGEGFYYFDGDVDIDGSSAGDEVIALFNDMFAFGVTDHPPQRRCGNRGVAAIKAFQQAALTPHRIANYQRIEVPVTFEMGKEGVVDANTRAEIRLWKEKGYRFQPPGEDFVERRVRLKNLGGSLPRSSALLCEIPSKNENRPRKLHCLAAAALVDMIEACKADIGVDLRVQSGWRRHRWKSRKHYEDTLIKKYGSVREGRKWLAYSSPHESGLAVDFGTGGLEPRRATRAKQKQTPAYKWLVANAYRFGFHPYKREPWHWEHPLSVRAWTTGESDWRLEDD